MNFAPPSLAQLFEPPEQHRGVFGWLCGYTADAGFLEDALERFSGQTNAQRAYQGRILLAMMLDPGNQQITPSQVPGALHLPAKAAKLPFALLHAKVAILGFEENDSDGFVVRVIVSTGNWTRETLEESLDLFWSIDVPSRGADTKAARQDCTDLATAWDFLLWLRQHFDLRLLEGAGGQGNETAEDAARLTEWINEIAKPYQECRPRFFDSRERSLFAQLPALVKEHARKIRRNYLALGSGFFEGGGSETNFVPAQILGSLQKDELVTLSCEKDLFVNPLACQAVAVHQAWIRENKWKIRVAHKPTYFGATPRSLHAKFIFSANWRDGSDRCVNPWVYLGSGNLTQSGFIHKAGPGGNLEAGVVFDPGTLRWEMKGKRDAGADVVTNLLPISWDDEATLSALQPGQEMPEREDCFIAAPVALFLWDERPERACLTPQGEVLGAFELLDPDGRPCKRFADGSFAWPGQRPREVTVTWPTEGKPEKAEVPVIDRHGRYCAADLPALDLEDVWVQLANFPMPPEDEELAGCGEANTVDGALADRGASTTPPSAYPVRRMMILVEDIAARQTDIAERDWMMWCNRLEQVLTQAKDDAVVKAFRSLALNPLSPLFAPAFRPGFAATAQTEQGTRYEAALAAVIMAWGLETYPKLGDLP